MCNIERASGRVEVGAGDHALAGRIVKCVLGNKTLFQQRAVVVARLAGNLQLPARRLQRAAGLRDPGLIFAAIDPDQDLARSDRVAFAHQHLAHFAGHLGFDDRLVDCAQRARHRDGLAQLARRDRNQVAGQKFQRRHSGCRRGARAGCRAAGFQCDCGAGDQ